MNGQCSFWVDIRAGVLQDSTFFYKYASDLSGGGGGGGVHPPFPGQKCLISPARLGIFSRNFDNVDKT